MSQAQIDQLHRNIEASKGFVALHQALVRLQSSPDFKTIIAQGYLRDEAVRLVHARSNVALQRPEDQAAILRDIDAIGSLEAFFRKIETQARQALSHIDADEETIADLLRGGDDE
jgi:hypothetical protein